MTAEFPISSIEQIEAELGKRLKRRRVERGFNQTELAERAGVVRRTVSSVERGEGCSMATFIALLRGLGALGDLQHLLPDPGPSPIALTEGGAGRVKERKYPYKPRARKKAVAPPKPWQWGDEK